MVVGEPDLLEEALHLLRVLLDKFEDQVLAAAIEQSQELGSDGPRVVAGVLARRLLGGDHARVHPFEHRAYRRLWLKHRWVGGAQPRLVGARRRCTARWYCRRGGGHG